jgi:putative flippase GtrA
MGGETRKESAWERFDARRGAKHPELWKILKWMAVGFIANVPELGVHMLCLNLFRDVANLGIFGFMANIAPIDDKYGLAASVYAFMISTAVGYAIAFVLNRKATFHADSNIALSTFLYVLMVCLIIYVNCIVGPIITDLVGKLHMPDNISQIISKFLCMIAAGVWSYPITRFVIHRKKKGGPADGQATGAA